VKIKDIIGTDDIDGFLDIAIYEGRIYLYDVNGNVYLVLEHREDAMVIRPILLGENYASRQNFIYKDRMFRVGLNENSILVKNMEDNETQKIYFKTTIESFVGTHVHKGYIKDNKFYFLSRYGQFYVLNLDSLYCSEISIKTNACYEEIKNTFFTKKMESNLKNRLKSEIIYENDPFFDLKDYLYIMRKDNV
jgi:hypothetical protein